jgi:hypothetical protein
MGIDIKGPLNALLEYLNDDTAFLSSRRVSRPFEQYTCLIAHKASSECPEPCRTRDQKDCQDFE